MLVSALAQAEASMAVRRFGLFVGANDGGAGRETLRWAESDARKMAEVMQDIGGVTPIDSTVIVNPSPAEFQREISVISRHVLDARQSARRVEFMLYYSGHSDETGLLLGRDRFTYADLRDAVKKVDADVTIAILDSCASGAFTRLKGGARMQPFLMDDSSQMKGHAFLTSSSENEASQESDQIESSVFTHYLISGLRGGADSTADGRVTLHEIYQYAHAETLARTERTYAGPQHPSYDIELNGTGDLVMTDINGPTASVVFDESLSGRLFVRDRKGTLLAEVKKAGGAPIILALPAGSYNVTMSRDETAYVARLELTQYGRPVLDARDFQVTYTEQNRLRGEINTPELNDQLFVYSAGTQYTHVPVNLSLVPTVALFPPDGSKTLTNFSFGAILASEYRVMGGMYSWLLNEAKEDVLGFQISGLGNRTNGDLYGIQHGGIFNITDGEMSGAQISGVFSIARGPAYFFQGSGIFNIAADSFSGLQATGIFNHVGRELEGVQVAGVFNTAGDIRGTQIGLINNATDTRGAQMGLINLARDVSGTQVGLVNISRDMDGVPVGLINIVKNGIHDIGLWWEPGNNQFVALQNGARHTYTLLYAGVAAGRNIDQLTDLTTGIGIGVRLGGDFFYADVDLSAKHRADGATADERLSQFFQFDQRTFPSLRVTAGISFGGNLGGYLGSVIDMHIPGFTSSDPVYHDGDGISGPGNSVIFYPRFVLGIKI